MNREWIEGIHVHGADLHGHYFVNPSDMGDGSWAGMTLWIDVGD